MKIKIPSRFFGLLLTPGLFLLAGPSLQADGESSTVAVKLSAPGKPSTLRIDMPWADIHIAGVDGDTVTVESSLAKKAVERNRNDGLRRLDDEVSFDLNEHDNLVRLTLAGENPWAVHDGDFKISVPRAMALDIKTEAGGDLDIKNVAGDIEVNAINGEVHLEGIAGSAVINTMNGQVRASYAQVPQKLVSITSMNGAISLRVPAETKANVRLRNQNGAIFTDFDEKTLKTKSESHSHLDEKKSSDQARIRSDAARDAFEADRNANREANHSSDSDDSSPSEDVVAPRPPHPPVPPITGGKLVSGTLNGGGVDIKISTMNGEITLRRTTAALPASAPSKKTSDRVTVIFQDPDNFTDIRESHSNMNSTADLEELRDFVRKTAESELAAGTTLTITFLDLDFAGEIRPDKDNIRIMTDTTVPRAHVKFQLVGANGEVLKEGERKLSDMNYQQSLSTLGRNDPLSHDKQLLKDWINREFKSRS